MKFDLQIIDSKHMDVLTKKENEITIIITEMTQRIADLKKLLDSKDVSLIFAYKSRNAEFKRSPKFKVSLPEFTSHKINKEEICKRFGFLTFSNKTKNTTTQLIFRKPNYLYWRDQLLINHVSSSIYTLRLNF